MADEMRLCAVPGGFSIQSYENELIIQMAAYASSCSCSIRHRSDANDIMMYGSEGRKLQEGEGEEKNDDER